MAKKKKINRDENGDPIVLGGKTFGDMLKPKNPRTSRTSSLKERADIRITMLLKKGAQADRLARKAEPIIDEQHLNSLDFQNNLANLPQIVQFAYYRGKLQSLREELSRLLESGNKKKIEFGEPAIREDIEETEQIMRELFHEIQMKRRIVKE